MIFLAYVFGSYLVTCVPVFISALIMEAMFTRWLDPKEIKAVGLFSVLGLLSGAAISTILIRGEELPKLAAAGLVAWGITGFLVLLLERRTMKFLANRRNHRRPSAHVAELTVGPKT